MCIRDSGKGADSFLSGGERFIGFHAHGFPAFDRRGNGIGRGGGSALGFGKDVRQLGKAVVLFLQRS